MFDTPAPKRTRIEHHKMPSVSPKVDLSNIRRNVPFTGKAQVAEKTMMEIPQLVETWEECAALAQRAGRALVDAE